MRKHLRLIYMDSRWLVIWVLIYVTFLVLDIALPVFWGSALLKYIGIFLCIVYANQKYNKDYNLQLALLFTFLADTILVWTPYAIVGVYIFCIAQFLHLTRLTKLSNIALASYAMILTFIFGICVALGLEPFYAIATVYAIELISNVTVSAQRYSSEQKSFRARCSFYGFIAFLCCDICVALRFLAMQGSLPDNIIPLVSYLVWVFYYPSQVLIANSSTMEPSGRRRFAKNKGIR